MQLPPPCRCRCRRRRWLQLIFPCASCVWVFELKTTSHAGAEAAHGPKQPPASPNVVVYACATNPRLATRAARIIAAVLAWLVPAAVSTHRGLCCARRL